MQSASVSVPPANCLPLFWNHWKMQIMYMVFDIIYNFGLIPLTHVYIREPVKKKDVENSTLGSDPPPAFNPYLALRAPPAFKLYMVLRACPAFNPYLAFRAPSRFQALKVLVYICVCRSLIGTKSIFNHALHTSILELSPNLCAVFTVPWECPNSFPLDMFKCPIRVVPQ